MTMADPAHSSAATIAATAAKSATSGGVTAMTLPVDPVTMAVGLIAALIALLHIPPEDGQARPPRRVVALVAGSGFLAGIFVPLAVAGGINYLPWVAQAGDRPLQLAAAAIIGALPHVAPVLWRLWKDRRTAP